ncbi:MAG: DUF177 domain-containing protein [Porphyromonas sp.]|nr:DUF177 domain-containing protein [Porphyromonas sp.]
MVNKSQHSINLGSLPQGESSWTCIVENALFADRNLLGVIGGEVRVDASIVRVGDVFECDFALRGYVVVICDRCLGEARMPIQTHSKLIVKLGEEYNDSEDEEIIVPRTDARLSLEQVLYEWVVLSLPISKGHPQGQCPQESLSILDAYHSHTTVEDEVIDPRWEQLRQLKEEK